MKNLASLASSMKSSKFDAAMPREDFPILATRVHTGTNNPEEPSRSTEPGKPLVYLDNAATSQKPIAVIDAITHYYNNQNANVHRGVHELSAKATAAYEQAREMVRAFIGASKPEEIIFTRGATEGLNLIASGIRDTLKPGDEIIVSELEHHSNIVPWQEAAKKTGAVIKVWHLREGELDVKDLDTLLSARTKVVSVTHVSNVLGVVLPVQKIATRVHEQTRAVVVVDGAQAVGHMPVDVIELDVDYYVFSGHKTYGPTGIGVVFGRRELLEQLPVYQTGGEMIESVAFESSTFAPLPAKFEAGTPHIAGAIGLAAALNYLEQTGLAELAKHESTLAAYARKKITEVPGVVLLGKASDSGIVSFVVDEVHPHDVGTILDGEGVAIRTGLLCAEPLIRSLGYNAVCRASFAGYNTRADVDALVDALKIAINKLRP